MKKTVSLLLVVAVLSTVVAMCFAGCNLFKSITLDEAKANLEGAGYEVTVMTGEEFVNSDNETYTITAAELEHYLYAVKGDDVIRMYFFVSVDAASDNYDFMSDSKLLGGQSNSVVYFATKQARKDAQV